MRSKGGWGKGSPHKQHKQQQTKRPSNNDPGTPTSKASDSKRPKQVGNQQSIVQYVSTDTGSSSGTNEIVSVASQEARKEHQQDEDTIMVIDEVPPLSPPKVTRATSEEVLTDPHSKQQQELASSPRPAHKP
jgi:hypothetical protein